MSIVRKITTLGCGLTLTLGAATGAFAQGKGLDEPFRAGYMKALAGKTVGYIPVAMGFDLTQGWLDGLKKELEPSGMKVVLRDPELEHQRRRAGLHRADRREAGGRS